MTEKQFEEAVAIHKRLEALQDAKRGIGNAKDHYLTYAYIPSPNDHRVCPSWATKPLTYFLAKHDQMIREEIEAEIESLKKRIENL